MASASTLNKSRVVRLLRGKQSEAARYAGISRVTVNMWCRGLRDVSPATRAKLFEFAQQQLAEPVEAA